MLKSLLCICVLLGSGQALAWGKRGHSLVCETAAYVVGNSKIPRSSQLLFKQNSFDLGYYCNVPDLIWKKPKNFKREYTNHYMNLEVYDREINKKDQDSAFKLTRKDFDKKYPKVPNGKGRSWWRIQELDQKLAEITLKLKNSKDTRGIRHKMMQLKWLTIAGVLGHYISDLAMPLHVSENYDGQLTDQKGLHHYFEETMVSELYLKDGKGLQESVFKRASKQWPEFKKKAKGRDILELAQELSKDSLSNAKTLLDLDKKVGRKSLEKSIEAHRELVVQRLVKGVLYQAHVFNKHLGWDYLSKGFYDFDEAPKFLKPGH
ncbi:MAG: hypothetical protein HRT44_03160 [Bdellovibrionales bacterium]|nr:hypothetical protein [Bdellovibrionales bacterium]NQZ18245.1 hypothetical protein [Bdellovibrionales bacterium]